MKKETYTYYLNDMIRNLIESANEIKLKPQLTEFEEGILAGYVNSISHLLNQTIAFNIKDDLDLDLQNFEPTSLLNKTE